MHDCGGLAASNRVVLLPSTVGLVAADLPHGGASDAARRAEEGGHKGWGPGESFISEQEPDQDHLRQGGGGEHGGRGGAARPGAPERTTACPPGRLWPALKPGGGHCCPALLTGRDLVSLTSGGVLPGHRLTG